MGFFNSVLDVATLGGSKAIRSKRREKENKYDEGIRSLEAQNKSLKEESIAEGRKVTSDLYGQDAAKKTGADVQDIIKRRRDLLDKPSGTAEAIQASGSRQVANIREGAGAAGGAIAGGQAAEQAKRQANQEAARATHQDYLASLGMYQDTISNVASAIPSIDLAYRNLGLASQETAPPKQVGLLDSILG